MTSNIEQLLKRLNSREYRSGRSDREIDVTRMMAGKSEMQQDVAFLTAMLEQETPVLIDGDSIGFYRSLKYTPVIEDDTGLHRLSSFGNIAPNYARVIGMGFDRILEDIREKMISCAPEQTDFYTAVTTAVEAVLNLADRYREQAGKSGSRKLHEALGRIPRQGAGSFYEACVFMKLILFTLRCNRNPHITLGRFDRYMFPYFQKDREAGVTEEELFEVLEEFFLSINVDTDLYLGVQQGDNGQSMVLGGRNQDGRYEFNELSALCMQASLELNLIDPKINLRVCRDTPAELYQLGTQLTKKGLGFPQYCNDDVVLPGLVRLGYSPEDAADYAVAACWEYIVPNCSADIPNIVTMNFPKVVNQAIHSSLTVCSSFGELMERVKDGIGEECGRLADMANRQAIRPTPYLSVFVDGCLEKGRDLSRQAAKYNNYGCHGAGIANAADALAAVKKTVYGDKAVEPQQLLDALDANFEGFEDMRRGLANCPKMGNNDDVVDEIAAELMDAFATHMNGRKNNRGGIFRAGTGSAMEYIWSAREVEATADGRKAREPYGSSFSPSLTTTLKGPLSLIQSFTKYDMTKLINGGPLTMEIHDTVFRNETGLRKVAQLVEAFIQLGGHQLQLNSVNRDRLLDAQKHPEQHPNLIVRVWGWSGYFNELDHEYQEHIIRRTEFSL